MVKQHKTVTATDGKVAMPTSGQALSHRREEDVTWHFPEVTKPNPWQTGGPKGPEVHKPSPAFQTGRLELRSPLCLHSLHPCMLGAGTAPCTVLIWGDQCPKQQCPREPGQHQHIRVHWHSAWILAFAWQQRVEAKANPCQASSAQWGLPGLPSVWYLTDLKNPRGKPYSTGRGHAQEPPPIPTQVLPAGSTRVPGPIGIWLHRMGSEGARGQALGWPWWHPGVGAGGHACIRSAAALLPQQRSGASAAASPSTGLGPGHRGAPQPPAPPHTAPGNTPGCPKTPPHGISSPTPASASLPGEGGCPHSSQSAPSPPSKQNQGGLARP